MPKVTKSKAYTYSVTPHTCGCSVEKHLFMSGCFLIRCDKIWGYYGKDRDTNYPELNFYANEREKKPKTSHNWDNGDGIVHLEKHGQIEIFILKLLDHYLDHYHGYQYRAECSAKVISWTCMSGTVLGGHPVLSGQKFWICFLY